MLICACLSPSKRAQLRVGGQLEESLLGGFHRSFRRSLLVLDILTRSLASFDLYIYLALGDIWDRKGAYQAFGLFSAFYLCRADLWIFVLYT